MANQQDKSKKLVGFYASPEEKKALAWCDGCLKRRLCITRKSGVIYEGKDCQIHLCRWCRGHETRRSANIQS